MGTRNSKVFSSADEQTKANWNNAINALKTNGYAAATISLENVNQTNLSAKQAAAIRELATAINNQMYESANKGEAAGIEAIAELRKLRQR